MPRTIVADTTWSALLLASLICTGPSFSYNRPDQLKHAYDYILCVSSPKASIIKSFPLDTHTPKEPQLDQRIFYSSILLLQFSVFP
ncbi:unnamed protein product [Hymenolepis diminuta]|uniref:Secreted protein n=1 Tax=Hymenolepis diminuta TaxID=6216 RepID=A0A564XVN9_HYMDI|nr:unnamed protein product [Hymenolepis diminuta]